MDTNRTAEVAIIGGTGVGQFPLDTGPEEVTVPTPWGETTVQIGTLRGRRTAFLARHGAGHRLPPHRIPFRANLAALKRLGVRAALATTAVGGLRADLRPGTLVLLDDFIDFTKNGRGTTFFDTPGQVVHTDFTAPYSAELRTGVQEAARNLNLSLRPGGTYLCADGPRYETPAEVRLFASWGADVVGMTGVPEATLAREAGIHYAGISLVTNPGAGLSPTPLTHAEVEEAMRAALPDLRSLLTETVAGLDAGTLPPVGPGVPLPGLEDARYG
uniref:Purine nucleoside phosphorylase n=1 Tax=uncultured Armatimonadetes bacterium TaxID=157466 RepID=A0A6J4H8F1_9BACT|nr:5'-methylthioadenosine phosphorylase [uncultured Armatimonadetes bacterium]